MKNSKPLIIDKNDTPYKPSLKERLKAWYYQKLNVRNLPYATSEQWYEWRTDFQTRHPKLYWIQFTALPNIVDVISYPKRKWSNLGSWIHNTFVSKQHYLQTGLPRGVYREISFRMLCANFNTLVEFIEVENAWSFVIGSETNQKKYKFPRILLYPGFGLFTWRCPQAGIDHLQYFIDNYSHEECGVQAKEILELYHWWKQYEANDYSTSVVSELSQFIDDMNTKYGDAFDPLGNNECFTQEEQDQFQQLIRSSWDKDTQEEQKVEDMLIRLIKVRNHLWT